MIKKILVIILMIGVMTTGFSEALTSNSVTYETEHLNGKLTLVTTEKELMILQDENIKPLFIISSSTKEQLRRIVGLYIEMDSIADKSNYITSIPPAMRSYDHKLLQFKMSYTALEGITIITIMIDTGTEPINIKFNLEQLNSLLSTLDEGFTYMNTLRDEVSKLRKKELEI